MIHIAIVYCALGFIFLFSLTIAELHPDYGYAKENFINQISNPKEMTYLTLLLLIFFLPFWIIIIVVGIVLFFVQKVASHLFVILNKKIIK